MDRFWYLSAIISRMLAIAYNVMPRMSFQFNQLSRLTPMPFEPSLKSSCAAAAMSAQNATSATAVSFSIQYFLSDGYLRVSHTFL